MSIRRFLRDGAFRLARKDLAHFLDDNEEHLVRFFREELAILDESIPEEHLYIDIHMEELGEVIVRAALHAITRFLREDHSLHEQRVQIPIQPETEEPTLKLKDSKT